MTIILKHILLCFLSKDFYHYFKYASWVNAFAHFEENEGLQWQTVLLQKRCWPGRYYGYAAEYFWTPESLVIPDEYKSLLSPPPTPPPSPPPAPPALEPIAAAFPQSSSIVPSAPALSDIAPGDDSIDAELNDKFDQIVKEMNAVKSKDERSEHDYDAAFDEETDAFILSLIEGSEEENTSGNIKVNLENVSSQETVIVGGEPMEVDPIAPVEQPIVSLHTYAYLFCIVLFSFELVY